ncbi:MAG: hypothetical protein CHACPFDD_03913 [Phycisphaerae bacterium]|nr:hypothetical protein [Phycisphaerae bacterium]
MSTNHADTPGPYILFVADRASTARFGRMLRQLAIGLVDAGVRVALLTDDAALATEFAPAAIEYHIVPALGGWRAWRTRAQLSDDFADRLTLVHFIGVDALQAVEGWARRRQIPTLVHVAGEAECGWLMQRGARPGQHVAGMSDGFCRKLCGHPPASFFPIRCFRPALLLSAETEIELPPPPDTLSVAWVGGWDNRPGLDLLLDAAEQVVRRRSAQFVLVGAGPGERAVRTAVHRRELDACVTVIGELSMWERAVQGAAILVEPSATSDVSLAPILAMSLGRAVLASDDQRLEWFVPDATCRAFAAGSAASLADAIEWVAAQPDGALALGRAARQWVRAQLSITQLTADLAEFYFTLDYPQRVVRLDAGGGGTP